LTAIYWDLRILKAKYIVVKQADNRVLKQTLKRVLFNRHSLWTDLQDGVPCLSKGETIMPQVTLDRGNPCCNSPIA